MKRLIATIISAAALCLGANAATGLTLNDGDTLTGVYEDYEITIAAGATVTFNGATITHTSTTAPAVNCLGDATIILAPGSVNAVTNTVGGYSCVRPTENAILTIRGSGTLMAAGGDKAAAIGSGNGGTCGSIVIEGGTIEALGGTTGAGIGSGYSGTCGSIVIEGGTVTAQGGDWSAGIGSAYYGTCGDITISGGTVTAEVDRSSTSDSGTCTAAIGAGCRGTCGNILISGGTVVADAHSGYSRDDACAIGATYTNGKCGDITLTTGITSLTATKGRTAQQFIGQGDGSATVGRIYGMLRFDKEYSNDGNTVTLTPKASFESYTVTWKNDDGTTADTTSVEYGFLPSHAGLTKAGDGYFEYLFAGWTPEFAEVESNTTYTAVFCPVPRARSTGGDAEWFFEADGSLRSGAIGNSENTWFRASLPRPCVFSFEWKTSSENGCDWLNFTVNGEDAYDTEGNIIGRISGVKDDWATVSVVVSNSLDVLEWKYWKDGSAARGQDCGWIRNFSMAPYEGEVSTLSVVPNHDGEATVNAYASKDCVLGVFPVVARHGYAFLGLFTAAEGGELVEPPYTLSANTTLYAHWAKTTDFDTSDPGAPWTIEDDGITWHTGAIGHNANTWATYTVKRPCTVTYKWKTSTEANNDPLVFYVDDVEQSRISGEMTDWADISLTFEDSANHVLKWVYYKDSSSTGTYDCGWIRDFVVTPLDSWAVTRNLNYEGAGELETRYVKKGNQLDVSEFPPLDEPREGYTCYWALAPWSGDALTNAVDISADTTLYAHWIKQHGFDEIDTTCQTPWTWLDDGSIRTGKIGDRGETWATISVTGPCDVSFKWKSSSEDRWDKLHFYVDTDHKTDISGAQDDWTTYSASVDSGEHVLKWTYTKDGSGSVGEDCGWIKDVVITETNSAPYTVTWKNADGSVLETDADLDGGAVPVYNSALPTQAATAQYYYDFAGWEQDFELVFSNTVYTAKYTATLRSYDVTWQDENGTELDAQTLYYGTTPEYAGETPTKAATPKYTYTFAGWTPEVAEVTGEATYTAKYDATINEYTITWKNDDGTVIDSADVAYDETPTHANPTKASTAQYHYEFAGWDPAVASVTGEATYQATFTPVLRSYTITWLNENGSQIDTTTVAYGATPTHAAPTKASTAQYDYTFAGWGEVVAVTGEATYQATFTPVLRSYTITWLNDDNSLIGTTTVAYGTTPTHAAPTKAETAEYTYTFAGWSPAVVSVTGAATYTATFNATKRSYTITWANINGAGAVATSTAEYGTTPSYGGATPTKAETAEYTYTFAGWSPAVASVTGAATYTAQFTPVKRSYTITWANIDGAGASTTSTFEYGATPAYGGATPTKAETAEYTYTFSGWSPAVASVTGPATYTAQFNATKRSYTITWANIDGAGASATSTVEYGTTPAYGGATPTKAETAEYTYTFTGWSPAIASVSGEATYTAEFEATKRSYTITWANIDGAGASATSTVEYGTTPTYSGDTPTKTETAEYTYTFSGWSPAIASVSGEATYTATFNATKRSYTITWANIDGAGAVATSTVEYGTVPAYGGATPTKAEDAEYTYTFAGWAPAVAAVESNTTYTATFDATPKTPELPEGVVDLSTLTGNYTAQDGDVLTGATGYAITIAAGATVTLDGVSLTNTTSSSPAVKCLGNATIVLAEGSDNSVVNMANYYSAIYPATNATLTIQGAGSLYVAAPGTYSRNYGAAIGSYSGGNPNTGTPCGNIVIAGGNITAVGGYCGAGVGACSYDAACGDITITGDAAVNATGGAWAAGIGAASDRSPCGDITISGNASVTATSTTYSTANSAGIGAGYDSACGDIAISTTGTVEAQGFNAAGIGAGGPGGATCAGITITSGTITAIGGSEACAIGASLQSGCGSILIEGGTITATGGANCPGVGTLGETDSITITGGNVTAIGGSNSSRRNGGAGIGSSYQRTCGDITISGGTVTATGGAWSAGIGSSYYGTCGDITISGGTVTANVCISTGDGETDTVAIGAGCRGTCGDILISGGIVVADAANPQDTRYDNCSAIGATYSGTCGDITITDGITSLTATKGATAQQHIGQGDGYATIGTVTISPRLAQSLSNSDLTLTLTPLDVPETVTVTWKNEDGTTLATDTVAYGATPTYGGETPTKAADAQYTYEFAGWTPAVGAATSNTTYTATFSETLRSYTVSWVVEGATVASGAVEYGQTPIYDGDTPTKESTAEYSYAFTGWNPTVVSVTGDATYTAQFSQTKRSYTITWVVEGATVASGAVEYGQTPTYGGDTPTKESTAEYSYTFTGWSPAVSAVTGAATYTAQFEATKRSYTVAWVVEGVTVASGAVEYGQTPAYSGDTPTKESTAEYSYEFSGWSPAVSAVTGAATYTAQFEATKRSYTVSWVVEGATVASGSVEYGTTPTYGGDTPTKESTVEYSYEFTGWSPAVSAVTGAATYTAQFEATKRSYTITWANIDGAGANTTSTVEYGQTPVYGGVAPTKAETEEYTYTFNGWTPAIVAVTGPATYTATFTATPKEEPDPDTPYDGTETTDGVAWSYTVASGEATITNADPAEGDIVIPDTVNNGVPVTAIAPNAFEGSAVTSVTIGRYVKTIGMVVGVIPDDLDIVENDVFYSAFMDCNALENFYVAEGNEVFEAIGGCLYYRNTPNDAKTLALYPCGRDRLYFDAGITVAEIGNAACLACHEFGEITIPATVGRIGIGSFYDTTMTKLVVQEGTTNICACAFYHNPYLMDAEIAGTVRYIGKRAFLHSFFDTEDCDENAIARLVLHEGIEEIDDEAFDYCRRIREVVIPDSVTRLGEYAFYEGEAKRIVIGNGVETISPYAFAENSAADLTIGANVKSIQTGAFYWSWDLTKLEIPNGVTNIGSAAFLDCENLRTVSLPDTLETIGAGAFWRCSSVKKLVVPLSVKYIGLSGYDDYVGDIHSAFAGMTGLERIYMPASLKPATEEATLAYIVTLFEDLGLENMSADERDAMLTWYSNESELGYATIRFNDGSTTTTMRVLDYFDAPLPVPSKSGYVFAGWWTGANGTGTRLSKDDTVTGDATYYAYWRETPFVFGGDVPWYAVYASYYDEDMWMLHSGETGFGETSTATLNVTGPCIVSYSCSPVNGVSDDDGVHVYLDGVEMDFFSHHDQSWSDRTYEIPQSGAHAVVFAYENVSGDEEGYALLANVTAEAAEAHTITFDPQGGAMSESTTRLVVRSTGILPKPRKDYAVFAGWFTAANGGTRITESHVVTQNLNLYAHWVDAPFTVGGDRIWLDCGDGSFVSESLEVGETIYAEKRVTGPCTVSFDLMVDTDYWTNNRFEVYVDGEEVAGFVNRSWTSWTVDIEEAGEHVVRWLFEREETGRNGYSNSVGLRNIEVTGGDEPVDEPDEKRWMVVDLRTGGVSYYGYDFDTATNTFNTTEYKTVKMAFRKVPKGEYFIRNGTKTATMERDYYMAIFTTTEAQYQLMLNPAANVSGASTAAKGSVSWISLRGTTEVTPQGSVSNNFGDAVIYRLNELTGLKFDLPTVPMWEVASLAKPTNATATASWSWFFGPTIDNLAEYAWNGGWAIYEVGLLKPNAWGLYDVYGNVWEWCADGIGTERWDMQEAFEYDWKWTQTPNGDGRDPSCRHCVGGSTWESPDYCNSVFVNTAYKVASYSHIGFRLSLIVDDEGGGDEPDEQGEFRILVGEYGVEGYEGTCPETITAADWPEGVTGIDGSAFDGCTTLKHLTLPAGLEAIGWSAFKNCTALETVDFSNCTSTLVEIGSWSFCGCTNLRSLVINGNDAYIGNGAFFACTSLASLQLGSGISQVYEYAFGACKSLATVTSAAEDVDETAYIGTAYYRNMPFSFIVKEDWEEKLSVAGFKGICPATIAAGDWPEGVESIYDYAFTYCDDLRSVEFPASFSRINAGTFAACRALESITFPATNEHEEGLEVGHNAFALCTNLHSVTLRGPLNVTMEAFGGCSGLTTVVVEGGVNFWGDGIFARTGVRSIVLPENMGDVTSGAFAGNDGIFTVYVPRSAEDKYGLESGIVEYDSYTPRVFGLESEERWAEYGFHFRETTTILKVEWIQPETPPVAVDDTKMVEPVVDEETGVRTVAAKDGVTLTQSDVESVAITSPTDPTVDITEAYTKTLSPEGDKIVLELAQPVIEEIVKEENIDAEDPMGLLEEVTKIGAFKIAELPIPDTSDPDPANHEEVGALPVKMHKGLWYQASWGDDLNAMTPGVKFRADGVQTHIGVIKQTGRSGFYKVVVSEK